MMLHCGPWGRVPALAAARFTADTMPLPDQRFQQIDYFYAPRLATEPAAAHEIRLHPLEPWSFSVIVRKEF